MSQVLAIAKKETRGFYLSPTFYVVCFLCAAIFSWVYPNVLNKFAEALSAVVFQPDIPKQTLNIHYQVFLPQLNILNLILIFVVPAFTMRLFAEEKKLRTFDLLLTSPVTSAQIVGGKFLATMAAIFGLCFLSFLYPAMTAVFTEINWTVLIIAFLGIFVVGGVFFLGGCFVLVIFLWVFFVFGCGKVYLLFFFFYAFFVFF